MPYYVYMVRCEDDSFYTGIATDVVRRMREHLSQRGACAKYTRVHKVIALAGLWTATDRSAASKLEYRIKRLSRTEKLELIAHPGLAWRVVPGAAEGDFMPPAALPDGFDDVGLDVDLCCRYSTVSVASSA